MPWSALSEGGVRGHLLTVARSGQAYGSELGSGVGQERRPCQHSQVCHDVIASAPIALTEVQSRLHAHEAHAHHPRARSGTQGRVWFCWRRSSLVRCSCFGTRSQKTWESLTPMGRVRSSAATLFLPPVILTRLTADGRARGPRWRDRLPCQRRVAIHDWHRDPCRRWLLHHLSNPQTSSVLSVSNAHAQTDSATT